MDLLISNIVNVSVAQAPAGAGNYNTSNIALFTSEPYLPSFGVAGFKIYLDPIDVATDFGTASKTYQMANGIFSQTPNMLAGNGYLVIIPILAQIDDLALSGIPASGSFQLVFPGGSTAAINWNDTTPQIQTKVQAVPGEANTAVTGSLASQDLKLQYFGQYGDVTQVATNANSLQTAGSVAITFVITTPTVAEEIGESIVRSQSLVQYFGLMGAMIFSQADILAAAAIVQPLNKIAFFVSRNSTDLNPGQTLDLLRSGTFTKSRGLYYGSPDDLSALIFQASYASRGLSTNFSGSNTTSTMNLKDLNGVQPDPTMTQTIYNAAKLAGADVYVSFQTVPKVASFGANRFFDQVYNQEWLAGALQIAVFNYQATTSTKIPQTEPGMTGLKGAIKAVADQAVTVAYAAPGQWNSATTFGNQADFLANIKQTGYYIFSVPISLQSQADRAARIAPLAQLALKEAGGVHSSSIIVNINA